MRARRRCDCAPRASACGTPWPGPAHWLALLALAWANSQSSPLLAREKCAANTLMSAAVPPFTKCTTASAVHYKPLRRINSTLEQFVAFKWSFPKKLEPLTPEALTIYTHCMHQMVPLRIDPFEPTEAEIAGDEPRSEQELRPERQASTRLSASRATTPYGTHKKANTLHEPLADTITQTTKPQEETSGDEPQAAQGKQPLGFDRSQHFLLIFSQRAINKIFIRIDTSKANFEGEHAQQHQTTPPNNWVPPQPPPAHPPKGATTPDAPVNLKYSTQGRRTLSKGNNTTLLHTTTHPLPNLKGNVLPTSGAPSPPPPAGSPRGGLTPDAPVSLKNSTLTYDHLGGWILTTGNKATPLPTSTHPLLKPEGGMLPTNWAPPPPLPADPPQRIHHPQQQMVYSPRQGLLSR
eukprot:scaffold6758_cov116-Isochrysis_galbana.AAC.1